MKNIIVAIIFTTITAHAIAMDLPEKKPLLTTRAQQNKRIDSINESINKAVENTSCCCGLFTKIFLERDHFDLLKHVNSYYENEIYEHDIDKLKKKNSYFAVTMDYFCDIAQQNYDAVTLSTLSTITDHTQPQPIKQLNNLSDTLKKHVLNMAYHKTRRVHSIEFIGHTARVRRVDINPQKNLACSASKDGTFRLWNLQTGKELSILSTDAVSGYVKFNDQGTLLATATLSQEEPFEITIQIWCTQTQKILWNIKHHNRFAALAFFQGKKSTTLAIFGQNNSALYRLKKNKEPMFIGTSTQSIPIAVDKGYKIKKRKEDNAWIAQKSAPCLYLCERAIENTAVPMVFNMQKIQMYQDLLESEKHIVDTLFNAKFLHTYTTIN